VKKSQVLGRRYKWGGKRGVGMASKGVAIGVVMPTPSDMSKSSGCMSSGSDQSKAWTKLATNMHTCSSPMLAAGQILRPVPNGINSGYSLGLKVERVFPHPRITPDCIHIDEQPSSSRDDISRYITGVGRLPRHLHKRPSESKTPVTAYGN
jgi:hypothetical protein